MPEISIRKIMVAVEETFHEGGPAKDKPRRKASALAVIYNPFAGRYEPEIAGFMEDLKPLGLELADKLIKVLGAGKEKIDGFGKGAIIGIGGELEHGALWHVPGGYAMRERLGDARAIVTVH